LFQSILQSLGDFWHFLLVTVKASQISAWINTIHFLPQVQQLF